MRHRRLTGALAALSLAAAVAAPAGSTGSASVHAACKSAVIVHKHKCIARGQFCKHTHRANRDYHKYGYHCGRRDRNGRYHLRYW